MALSAVVTTQIGNLFAQRAENTPILKMPLFNNKLIWFGILSELVVIAMIVYVPALQRFIGTASFSIKYWLFLLAWSPLLMIADEIRKIIKRKKKNWGRRQGG